MKTILITGASDGIGKSMAHRFAKDKNHLILFGRNENRLAQVKSDCEKLGAQAETFAFDITDAKALGKVVAKLADTQIDVLINNAGVWHKAGDVTTLDEETITGVINTNLTSHILLTRALLAKIRGRKGAAIVNVISKSGVVAQAGQSVYSASKYGMKGFTDVLREDTKNDAVRVAGVYQSGTNTGFFAKTGEEFPTDDFTDPDDLAEVVAFMLSRPENLWVNEIHVEQ